MVYYILQISIILIGIYFIVRGSINLIKGYKLDRLLSFFIQISFNKKQINKEKRKK